MSTNIPTWDESERAVMAGNASPLHVLIYEHEPAGEGEEKFRSALAGVVRSRDAEIMRLRADLSEAVGALERSRMKLLAYVGVCRDDKELNDAVLPMARAVLAKHNKA